MAPSFSGQLWVMIRSARVIGSGPRVPAGSSLGRDAARPAPRASCDAVACGRPVPFTVDRVSRRAPRQRPPEQRRAGRRRLRWPRPERLGRSSAPRAGAARRSRARGARGARPVGQAESARPGRCRDPQASALRRWLEELPQGARQLELVEVAHDPGALDEADLAVLLGDDHDDRVGLLGRARGPRGGGFRTARNGSVVSPSGRSGSGGEDPASRGR